MKLKEDLFKEIKNVEIKDLISISLVGSFKEAKKTKLVMDVDLIVLVKKLTPEIFGNINFEFEKLSKKLSDKKNIFFVENRIAAVKMQHIKGKRVFQLHILAFDKEWFVKHRSDPLLFDWVNFNKKIMGQNLREIIKIPRLNKDKVIYDMIHKRLPAMKKKAAYGGIYHIKGEKLILKNHLISLRSDEYAESLCQAITISFLNYIRLFSPKFIKNKENLLKVAKIKLSKEHYLLIKDVFIIKEKLGLGKKIHGGETTKLKERGRKFIVFLAKDIKNKK